jgi:diguanylate cyclase (GGDEF)-like protein
MTTSEDIEEALDGLADAIERESAKPFILVVDDSPDNVRVLYEILKDDFEICGATTGADALEICLSRPPDVILLDVNMPGMDGHEVCRRLKSFELTREIPIIFVTALDSPQAEAQALGEGASDFISRPFHEQVVKARVRNQITLKLQGDTLRSLAMTDGLTGIANRRRFDEALAEECRRATRDRSSLSLVVLDVDRFKGFNDEYGHLAGDRCLKVIASTIKTLTRRPGDLVARYGGEEIVVLLPRADSGFASQVARKAVVMIEALHVTHSGNIDCGGVVTVSAGVVTFRPPDQPLNPEALVAAADQMLYEAKRSGRNRVVSWVPPATDTAPAPDGEETKEADHAG